MSKLNVDVEEIMKQIREQAEQIDDLDTVDFEDVSISKKEWTMPHVNEKVNFRWDSFWNELSNANRFCNVDFTIPVPEGNFFATIIRKITVKLVRFYFKIMAERQNDYNANSVRTLNEVGNFIRDTEIAVNRQNEINEKIMNDIEECKLLFNKECIKRLEASDRQNKFLRQEIEALRRQIEFLRETQEQSD